MIDDLVKAFTSYRTAVNNDELSTATDDAKIPQMEVYTKGGAMIVLLPERHSSTDDAVKGAASTVATKVMAIKKVKVAIEEPISMHGKVLSNVGWGDKPISGWKSSDRLFTYDARMEGSISHQLFTKQVENMVIGSTRFAAETSDPRLNRYTQQLQVNQDMATNLNANTSGADLTVYPVGPDHMKTIYHQQTVGALLVANGWTNATQTYV